MKGSGQGLTMHKPLINFFLAALMVFMWPPMALGKANLWWDPAISLQSSINDNTSDEAPGHIALIGETLTHTVFVENVGETLLFDIQVFDGEKTLCTPEKLFPGDSAVCTRERVAAEGPQALNSQVTARSLFWWKKVLALDTSHYYGIPGYPAVTVKPLINGEPAETEPGPELTAGENYERTFLVNNTGKLELSNVTVEIRPEGEASSTACVIDRIASGEQGQCREIVVAEAGHQSLDVAVIGQAVAGLSAQAGSDLFYTGVERETFAAKPVAEPDKGTAPLTVTFTPEATTDTAIERYHWDFNGDGVFDVSETVGRTQQRTYNNPGEYEVTLRLTDSRGETTEGTVTVSVSNQPPTITNAEASPSNGESPLAVRFSVSAEDADGISRIEFDFEGDGNVDVVKETSGVSASVTVDHVYENQGVFQPVIRVTDSLGGSSIASFPTLEVKALEEGSPSVTATVSTAAGKAPLSVTLDASASDPDGLDMVLWEWDLDGDGNFDQSSSTDPGAEYSYHRPGTYYPRVRVTAEDGQTAEDVVQIKVDADFDLRVSQDTIDTTAGDSVVINTSLGGDLPVSVIMETPAGDPIRTLVPWQERQAGEYADTWDGTNEEGEPVEEGEYRAILLYEIDGERRRLDAGTGTGGRQYNPSRSTLPSTFTPLAGEELSINFTLPEASEVTAFMGLFNINTRLVTFMQRKPLGKGTHQITWNGEDDSGALLSLPDGESYLFGIWGWTLPDNAIYVRSGAHITAMDFSPRILVPSSRSGEGSSARTTIDFTLEGAADVELTVDNTETGTQLLKTRHSGFSGGDNTIVWDGRDDNGELVAPGTYRIGITAIDPRNFRSVTVYGLQQVYY